MRLRYLAALLAGVGLATGIAVSGASAQSGACFRLWVQRNQIYKDAGYCFNTARAIRYFGNEGCRYRYQEDVPLSRYQRQQVGRILAEERYLGCR